MPADPTKCRTTTSLEAWCSQLTSDTRTVYNYSADRFARVCLALQQVFCHDADDVHFASVAIHSAQHAEDNRFVTPWHGGRTGGVSA